MKFGNKIALVYERHDQDSRYKELKEICETVSTKYGTGGGNMPIVLEKMEDENAERILGNRARVVECRGCSTINTDECGR